MARAFSAWAAMPRVCRVFFAVVAVTCAYIHVHLFLLLLRTPAISKSPLVLRQSPVQMLAQDAGSPPTGDIGQGRSDQVLRKQVTWVHLHKFGGTFMTKLAGLQGERFPADNINANWMPDFCSTPTAGRIPCAIRTNASSDVTWSAVEREVDDGDFCNGALLGTMLREPLGALQSVVAFDGYDKKAIMKTLTACDEVTPAAHSMYRPPWKGSSEPPLCLPPWDTYQHFDNFATRSLGSAYSVPPCAVNQTHLDRAKLRLQKMDVVMILEEFKRHLPQLQNVFHWNTTSLPAGKRANRSPKRYRKLRFSVNEMTFLESLNAIDIELYNFGMSLAQRLTHRAQHTLPQIDDEQSMLKASQKAQDEASEVEAIRELAAIM